MTFSGFVDATSLEALANIVVTDTKLPQLRNSATQNIAVLHSGEFERQTTYNRNLAELMLYTSGQFVNVLSRNDANWGSYAGLGPKYNSYLLDGVPIDSFVDPMSLDSWAIERIEAYKGPASVLYSNYLSMDFAGNETPLAGTTNLILRERIDASATKVQTGYGSYGTFNGRAYHQDRQGDLSYFFGVGDEKADYTQFGAPDSWLQTVSAPSYNKLKAYGKLSYAFGRNNHVLSLFTQMTDHNGSMGRPARDFKHAYGTFNLAYSNQLTDSLHVQFKAGERSYDRRFGNDNFPASLALTSHDQTRQHIRPLDLTLSYLHAGNAMLTAGIDRQTVSYQTDSIGAGGAVTPQNSVNASSNGIYAQEKLQLGDWVLRGGVRHNNIRHDYLMLGGNVPATTGASWSKSLWSLGARYNFSPDLSVYANAGSSFMTPAAKQIGGTVSLPTDSGQLPNPVLNPETGVGQDIGIDWRPSNALTLGLRGFANRITSAIVDNVVSVTPSQTRAVNAGSATATGLEFDLEHSLSGDTRWFANLTATHARIDNPTDADQNGTAIPFVPDYVSNLGLATRIGGTDISVYYHRVGRYWDNASRSGRLPFGNYDMLNVRLQHELKRSEAASTHLFVELNNLANRRFDLPWGFRDPGFNAFAGLSASF